jgi:hypothetical protein
MGKRGCQRSTKKLEPAYRQRKHKNGIDIFPICTLEYCEMIDGEPAQQEE